MSGKTSRRKGKTGERKARKLLRKLGYVVEWTAFEDKPDLYVEARYANGKSQLINQHWEIKYRKNISKAIYQYLEEKGADVLLCKRVNKKDGRSYPWLKIERFGEEVGKNDRQAVGED